MLAISGSASHAKELATAMDVDPTAFVRAGGTARAIISGNRLSQGDVIETRGAGQVQVLFDDQTRIVIGPNSRLVVEDILMNSGKSANRFAVTAVKGSFRFITGRSSKSAYEIRTPTATMGVRGTTFDFAVNRARETDLAVLYGAVRFCGRGGQCQQVRQGCNLAYADRRGNVGIPASREEGANRISRGFPYLFSQASLMGTFRTRIGVCSRFTQLAKKSAAQSGTGIQGISGPASVTSPGAPSPSDSPGTGSPGTGSPGSSGAAGGNSGGRGGGNSGDQQGNSGGNRNDGK